MKVGSLGSSIINIISNLNVGSSSPYKFIFPVKNSNLTAGLSYNTEINNSTNDNGYLSCQKLGSPASYIDLEFIEPGINNFNWLISQFTDSGSYRLAIWDGTYEQYFYSDTFHISMAAPELTIKNPVSSSTANAFLQSGKTFLLEWSAVGSGPISVLWSRNGGSTWDTIALNINSPTGQYDTITLTAPLVTTTYKNCFLKIVNKTSVFSVITNVTVSDIPPYQFINPTKNSKLVAGDTVAVQINDMVNNSCELGLLNIYNPDFYEGYINYYENAEGIINYNWDISSYLSSGYYQLYIYDYSLNKYFYSDTFYINPAKPSLQLTFPNTGATYLPGGSYWIDWSAVNSGNINIELSDDNGVTWDTVGRNIISDNSSYNEYQFAAPVFKDYTANGILKISNINNTLSSYVTGIKFNNKPAYYFTNPTNQTKVNSGSILNVAIYDNYIDYNYLYLYYGQIGGSGNLISEIYSSDSLLNTSWNIPKNIDTGKYQLYFWEGTLDRYYYSDTFTVINNSSGDSTAGNGSLQINWPIPGTIIYSNSKFKVLSSGYNYNESVYNVELSVDGGITWDTLAKNYLLYDSLFQFTAPVFSKSYTNGIIKISNAANTSYALVSNVKFYPDINSTGGYDIIYMDNENYFDTVSICNNDTIKLVGFHRSDNINWFVNNTSISDSFGQHDTIYLTIKDTAFGGWVSCESVNPWIFGRIVLNSLKVYGQNDFIYCGDTAKLTVLSNYTGNGSIKYSWTPVKGLNSANISNPLAILQDNTQYKVSIATSDGCKASGNIAVTFMPLPSPEICMVSVDSTDKNIIYWEKPIATSDSIYLTPLDSFYIYKETNATNVYEKIGSVSYNDPGYFVDYNSHPDIQSNTYEITIKDPCDFESDKSWPHKTMHLSISEGQNNSWNLIWEPYEGFYVSTYNIYRGTSSSNMELIGSTSGSSTQYTDYNAPSGYVYYQIGVVNPNNCIVSYSESSKKSENAAVYVVESLSNIATNGPASINTVTNETLKFMVYPNPARDVINIISNSSEVITNGTIKIIDDQGSVVLNTILNASNTELNISNLNSGVYTIIIITDKNITTEKIVHIK